LNITVTPLTGQPDIYVAKEPDDGHHLTKEDLTWAAFADNDYQIIISHWDPESSPGYYYIGINNDCSGSNSAEARYTLSVLSFFDDDDDIIKHPNLAMKKYVAAYNYDFYKFCVPECSDVKVTLHNCVDKKKCPDTYAWQEMIVSRTDQLPITGDYSWKLASISRRFVWINATNPAARDHNEYLTGAFYLSVYGYSDAPGTEYEAHNILNQYNVTVELFPRQSSQCDVANLVLPEETDEFVDAQSGKVKNYITLQSGVSNPGFIEYNGNEYTSNYYYRIAVPDPCYEVNVFCETNSPNLVYASAQLAVGKYPTLLPTFDNINWFDYDYNPNNVTISAWDPEFDGGKNCGKRKDGVCWIYIGVIAWVDSSAASAAGQPKGQVTFTLTATLKRTHKIFNVPQIKQTVQANGVRQYGFCITDDRSVMAELLSYTEACTNPQTYTDLEMVISRTNANAGIRDYTWRVGHSDAVGGRKQIELPSDNGGTRPGAYFLNVLGWCQSDTSVACTANACTCAPCSHVSSSPYSLLVNWTSTSPLATYDADLRKYVTTVTTPPNPNTCSAQCKAPTAAPTASPVSKLSEGEIAAAVIMSLVGAALICVGSYYMYMRCNKTPYAAASAHGDDKAVQEETSVELNSRA